MRIVAFSFVLVACTHEELPPTRPQPCPAAPVQSATAASAPTCTLFDKSVVGWTMKRAVFRSELVGGSAGERAAFAASKSDDPAGYDSFWNCTAVAMKAENTWCECPRGPNRAFEDMREKDLKGHVVWIDR